MSGQIRMSETAMHAAIAKLRQGVDDYCSFRLPSLAGAAPSLGSFEHDGRICALTTDALSSFAQVVEADICSLEGMGNSFAAADRHAASSIESR